MHAKGPPEWPLGELPSVRFVRVFRRPIDLARPWRLQKTPHFRGDLMDRENVQVMT